MNELFKSSDARLILASANSIDADTMKSALLAEAKDILKKREALQLSVLQNYSIRGMLS